MKSWIPMTLAALCICCAATASAQRRRTRVGVDEVRALLDSNDASEVSRGIETIGLSGSARLVAPLADRIRRGLPPDLLELAVDTLTVLGRPEAGPVLFVLGTHRRPTVRRKAIEAIIACHPRGADRALVVALSDSDPQVRAAAALGLGQMGARASTGPLFLALDRGVVEASTAIGELASGEEAARLLGYLGRLPLDVLTPALMELLARDDLPQGAKLEVVARLAELATPEARTVLQDFVASLPQGRRGDRVRRAAEDAILRIAD